MENKVNTIETLDNPVSRDERPTYETPQVTVLEEAEVLKTFQFTSAAPTWWIM